MPQKKNPEVSKLSIRASYALTIASAALIKACHQHTTLISRANPKAFASTDNPVSFTGHISKLIPDLKVTDNIETRQPRVSRSN
jgi:hypothetical protein